MISIFLNNLNENELKEFVTSLGLKGFRGDQIFRAINNKSILEIDDIPQISKSDKKIINEKASISKLRILEIYKSKLDETRKLLYLLHDNNIIEGVLMKYKYGYSLCVSTQVGCRMGCDFCASTKNGMARNLNPGEITGQIYAVEKHFGIQISTIVLMGSGEPFDNYDNVIKGLEILNDPKGRNLSMRNITISTCGLAEKIVEFGKSGIKANLAVSIHSFDDEIRSKIMPVNKKYDVNTLMKAVREYYNLTKNRVSFEYTVIDGENNREKDVELIRNNLKDINYIVNLIALNPINEYNKINSNNIATNFKKKLEENKINVTLRRELGSDISASCGQLKKHYLEEGGFNEI